MKKFAETIVKYLRKHKFDGLDLGMLFLNVNSNGLYFSFLFRFWISRYTNDIISIFILNQILRINTGVDWRDSPKEDKQKFTRMCEVSRKIFLLSILLEKKSNHHRYYTKCLRKKRKHRTMNDFSLLRLSLLLKWTLTKLTKSINSFRKWLHM